MVLSPGRVRRRTAERAARSGVFLLCLVPLARIIVDALTDSLGANPIEEITHRTGWWTLTFLMLALAVTPVRKLTGWGRLITLRRTLGLFAFFYATLHFSIYIGLDQFFAFEFILEDIMERPYITVGFAALVILVPLAVTSTKKMVKRLGGKGWNRLHRMVYVAAALGVLHFLWLVKADIREPVIFASILAILLGYRAGAQALRRSKIRRSKTGSPSPALDSGAAPARTRVGTT